MFDDSGPVTTRLECSPECTRLRARVAELEDAAIRNDERHAEAMASVRKRAERAEARVRELEALVVCAATFVKNANWQRGGWSLQQRLERAMVGLPSASGGSKEVPKDSKEACPSEAKPHCWMCVVAGEASSDIECPRHPSEQRPAEPRTAKRCSLHHLYYNPSCEVCRKLNKEPRPNEASTRNFHVIDRDREHAENLYQRIEALGVEKDKARIVGECARMIALARTDPGACSETASHEPVTLWATPPDQCESTSPDKRHSCTLIEKHWGVHVALDPVTGAVLDAWLSVPTGGEGT